MKKHDSRKLPKKVLQHNRNQAIRLFQEGQKRKEIAEIVGLHYTVVCKWIRAWNEGGEAAKKTEKTWSWICRTTHADGGSRGCT